MSKRKQTDTQQLITFGLGATEDTLNSAIESLTAIRDSKFPRTPAKPKAPRKPRADAGTKRKGLPPSAPNGGDTNASPTE